MTQEATAPASQKKLIDKVIMTTGQGSSIETFIVTHQAAWVMIVASVGKEAQLKHSLSR